MCLAVLLLIPFFSVAVEEAGDAKSAVKILTDENFEHDTQASSGATTGDWLVEFYAPWCGHCKNLAPIWEQLAQELKGNINVASIDATVNTNTAARFRIKGYPTIKLLRQGKVYDYKGARTVPDFTGFLKKDWKESDVMDIPPPISTFGIVIQELQQIFEDIKILILRKVEAVAAIFATGLLIGVVMAMLVFTWCVDRDRGIRSAPSTPQVQNSHTAKPEKQD